jgi:hypothetical protein
MSETGDEAVAVMQFPNADVRSTVLDGEQHMSIRDLLMVSGDTNYHIANQVWRNLERKDELQDSIRYCRFPGSGQSAKPVITMAGARKLAMFVPGKYRVKMAKMLQTEAENKMSVSYIVNEFDVPPTAAEAENKMSISYIVNEFDVPPTASDSLTEQPVIMFPGAHKLSLSPFYTHWASDA